MRRLNITLPEDLVELVDKYAKERQISRSEFLREAAKDVINRHQKQIEEKVRKKRITKAIETQDRLRKKIGKWDGVGEVRRWRETQSRDMS